MAKKGMQMNSMAPKESMMTGKLSGKMEGKPMKGTMGGSRMMSGGGGSKGMGKKGKMGY